MAISLKKKWDRVDRYVLKNFSARDYGTKSNKEALKKQVNYMRNKTKYGSENNYQVGVNIARGGNVDVSTYNMKKRLDKFGYSTKGLQPHQVFEKYQHVIGSSVDRILKKGGK